MPGYYYDNLEGKYPGEFPNPERAFIIVDGSRDFPELVLLLKQTGRFSSLFKKNLGLFPDEYRKMLR